MLAQQGNFQILLIASDANRRQHIEDEADESVQQCEDHTHPMPKAIILTEVVKPIRFALILTGAFGCRASGCLDQMK